MKDVFQIVCAVLLGQPNSFCLALAWQFYGRFASQTKEPGPLYLVFY